MQSRRTVLLHCCCRHCGIICLLVLQVSSCLASIAQGMHTKSRAWVARKSGQQQQQRISQQGANPADPFAQSPFEALSSAMGDGTAAAAAAADVAAGSFMDGLLGLSRAGAGVWAAVVFLCCYVVLHVVAPVLQSLRRSARRRSSSSQGTEQTGKPTC
jgi:hypothetical protein